MKRLIIYVAPTLCILRPTLTRHQHMWLHSITSFIQTISSVHVSGSYRFMCLCRCSV